MICLFKTSVYYSSEYVYQIIQHDLVEAFFFHVLLQINMAEKAGKERYRFKQGRVCSSTYYIVM
jgi:hypothetical protein